MKKLLSILAATVLASTSATSVVACSSDMYKSNVANKFKKHVNSAYDEDITKASIVARAKSLIVDKEFNLNDSKTRDYALNNNKVETYFVTGNNTVDNTSIAQEYDSYIDDTSLSNAKGFLMNGEVGQDGGVFNKLEDTVFDLIKSKLPPQVVSLLGGILDKYLTSQGFNTNILGNPNATAQLATALKPILSVITKVNTKVAMQGIPVGLDLIPDLTSDSTLFSLVNSALGSLTGSFAKTVTGFVDQLITITDFSTAKDNDGNSYKDYTVSDMQKELAALMGRILTNPYSKSDDGKKTELDDTTTYKPSLFGDIMRFISLAGYYLTSFDDAKDLAGIQSIMGSTDPLSKSDLFNVNNQESGKGFNVAPLLNEVSHYLGNGIDEDKTLRLLQILFTDKDGNPNPIANLLIGNNGVLFNAINSFLTSKGGTELKDNELPTLTKDVLANKVADDADGKGLFGTNKPFDVIFNDWTKLDTLNGVTEVGTKLRDDDIWQRVFLDDNTDQPITPSLENLLKAPLYKLLLMNSYLSSGDSQEFSASALAKNGGLLPNYAGHYTEESIAQLAGELKRMFGLSSDNLSMDQMKYHYFDFNNLKELVNDLLVEDTDDGLGKSLVSFLMDNLTKSGANTTIGQAIGYEKLEKSGKINPKVVRKNSFVGKLISSLLPKATTLPGDTYTDDEISETLIDESDNLQLLFGGLSSFASAMIEGTNYNYWFKRVLANTQNDNHNDPNSSAWFYDNKKNSSWTKYGNYGFDIQYFDNSHVIKSISLVIKFDISKFPSILSKIQADPRPVTYKISLSRDNENDLLSYDSIQSYQ